MKRGSISEREGSRVQLDGISPIVSRVVSWRVAGKSLTSCIDLLEIASDAPMISIVSENPTRPRTDSSTSKHGPAPSPSPHSSNGPADKSDDTFPPTKTLAHSSRTQSVGSQRSQAPRMVLLTQISALSRREVQNLRRDLLTLKLHNAVAVIIGLFVGGICQSIVACRRGVDTDESA